MSHFKKMPQNEKVGKIIYGDAIIKEIVVLILSELENIELFSNGTSRKSLSKAVDVNIEKDGVHIDIDIGIHFSENVSDVAFKVQEAVRSNIEAMTEYKIASVNVNVKSVSFKEKETAVRTENQ